MAAAMETRQLASWAEETSTVAKAEAWCLLIHADASLSLSRVQSHLAAGHRQTHTPNISVLTSQIKRANRKDSGAHAADTGYAMGERWRC